MSAVPGTAKINNQRPDPVGRWTGFYEEQGHFYTTYMTAIASGLDKNRAYVLAYYSQYADEHPANSAFASVGKWIGNILFHFGPFRETQTAGHVLWGGRGKEIDGIRAALHDEITQRTLTDRRRGFLIHPFGDSYAHTMLKNGEEVSFKFPFGHLAENDKPDRVSEAPEKFSKYVESLADALAKAYGTKVDPSKLKEIVDLANSLKKGTAADDEIKNFRHLAESKDFGYDKKFHPERSNLETDGAMEGADAAADIKIEQKRVKELEDEQKQQARELGINLWTK